MSEARIWHGGDLDEARQLFPQAPEPWIDLSTGINPIAYPMPALPASRSSGCRRPPITGIWRRPPPRPTGRQSAANVVAAPGTQILISLLPTLWPRSRVAVLGPTYAEHAHAWRGAGHEVAEISSRDEIGGADILVLVNPNNPDGRTLERAVLLEEAGRLRRRGGWLVVDEAFADFDAGETLVPVLPDNAIVLRSFGKTYGLAGIRLGFAIASESMAMRLRTMLGPWAVSGPAIAIGRQALRDREWRRAGRSGPGRGCGPARRAAGAGC